MGQHCSFCWLSRPCSKPHDPSLAPRPRPPVCKRHLHSAGAQPVATMPLGMKHTPPRGIVRRLQETDGSNFTGIRRWGGLHLRVRDWCSCFTEGETEAQGAKYCG